MVEWTITHDCENYYKKVLSLWSSIKWYGNIVVFQVSNKEVPGVGFSYFILKTIKEISQSL